MKKTWKIALGLAAVFIATLSLFYIFDSLNKVSIGCKSNWEESTMCVDLSGITSSMLVILLLIAGFIFAILAISYILISS